MKLIEVCNRAFLNSSWYPKYIYNSWVTYCNKAVRFICEEMNTALPLSAALANNIYEYLTSNRSHNNWKEIEYKDAFFNAKKGELIVVVQKGIKHGHCAVLYPADDMQYSYSFGGYVPIVFNFGMTIGIMKLSYAFKANPKPRMFIRVNK
jgi:hypothetical protein